MSYFIRASRKRSVHLRTSTISKVDPWFVSGRQTGSSGSYRPPRPSQSCFPRTDAARQKTAGSKRLWQIYHRCDLVVLQITGGRWGGVSRGRGRWRQHLIFHRGARPVRFTLCWIIQTSSAAGREPSFHCRTLTFVKTTGPVIKFYLLGVIRAIVIIWFDVLHAVELLLNPVYTYQIPFGVDLIRSDSNFLFQSYTSTSCDHYVYLMCTRSHQRIGHKSIRVIPISHNNTILLFLHDHLNNWITPEIRWLSEFNGHVTPADCFIIKEARKKGCDLQ